MQLHYGPQSPASGKVQYPKPLHLEARALTAAARSLQELELSAVLPLLTLMADQRMACSIIA
jgi:hypothetical protein